MNYKEEWERISELPIDEVKLELHKIEKELKKYPAGGISYLNAKRLMYQLRLEKLNK